jgi:hypothetical protein
MSQYKYKDKTNTKDKNFEKINFPYKAMLASRLPKQKDNMKVTSLYTCINWLQFWTDDFHNACQSTKAPGNRSSIA